jgi:hypothetical protein
MEVRHTLSLTLKLPTRRVRQVRQRYLRDPADGLRAARQPGGAAEPQHLRELGLERRAVDAVFRACPVVALPGYSRPVVRVRDYLALLDESTHDGVTRVR